MRRTSVGLRILCVLVLGLRALVPTGYMYGMADGHAGLIMCPAGLHSGMPAHHMPVNSHGGHAPAAEQCPFALAAAAGLLAAGQAPPEPYFQVVHPVAVWIVASLPAAPPSRYHAPRGPPSLV